MTSTATTPSPPASSRRHWRWRQLIGPLISIVIVVAVFWYFLPQFTSLSDVWASVKSMTWMELATLTLLALWNLWTYSFVFVLTMPGLRDRQAMVVIESSTAVANTLPGGGAIGIGMTYSMCSSWGFSRSRTSVSLLVAGIWNNFAKLALPIIALALLAVQGNASGARLFAAAIGVLSLVAAIAIFRMLLRSDASARWVGERAGQVASALLRRLGRPPVSGWDLATIKFRQRTVLLLRARWIPITVATLVSHLSLYVVLLVTLRHVGVSEEEVSWVEVLAVFALARLLTAIPLTPGGLGIVDVALITGLAAAGGDRAEVAAAVLIFRALTYVLPIPIGLGTYVFWRRNRSWRRPPNSAPRTDLVPETG